MGFTFASPVMSRRAIRSVTSSDDWAEATGVGDLEAASSLSSAR